MSAFDHVAAAETVGERRLRAEWHLLGQLVALNPARLARPMRQDSTFEVTLLGTPALLDEKLTTLTTLTTPTRVTEHRVRMVYPRFFPSVPLELYVADPVLHPNVHPLTGFVCLWDRHRVSNTVEHALHKTVAILGWRLLNPDARHVMQPNALARDQEALAQQLAAPALLGVEHAAEITGAGNEPRRRRLS